MILNRVNEAISGKRREGIMGFETYRTSTGERIDVLLNSIPRGNNASYWNPADTDDPELDPTTAFSRILPVQARSGSSIHSRSGTIYNGFDVLKSREILKVLNDSLQG